MRALIFSLATFGYIDGDFDAPSKSSCKRLHRRAGRAPGRHGRCPSDAGRAPGARREVHDALPRDVRAHRPAGAASSSTKPSPTGEDQRQLRPRQAQAALLRDLPGLRPRNQEALLTSVDELIHADGEVHPAEMQVPRRAGGAARRATSAWSSSRTAPSGRAVSIAGPTRRSPPAPRTTPSSSQFEHHYSAEPPKTEQQMRGRPGARRQGGRAALRRQRDAGTGKLSGVTRRVGRARGQRPASSTATYVLTARGRRKPTS